MTQVARVSGIRGVDIVPDQHVQLDVEGVEGAVALGLGKQRQTGHQALNPSRDRSGGHVFLVGRRFGLPLATTRHQPLDRYTKSCGKSAQGGAMGNRGSRLPVLDGSQGSCDAPGQLGLAQSEVIPTADQAARKKLR